MKRTGSRAEVMHGTAHQTVGGLTKSDLIYVGGDKDGKGRRIASKKMVARGKALKREAERQGKLARPFTKSDGGRKRKRSRSRSRSRRRR